MKPIKTFRTKRLESLFLAILIPVLGCNPALNPNLNSNPSPESKSAVQSYVIRESEYSKLQEQQKRDYKKRLEEIAFISNDPIAKSIVETKQPFYEFEDILRQKKLLKPDYSQGQRLSFMKDYYGSIEQQREILNQAFTKPLTEQDKLELTEFLKNNPWTESEKKEVSKNIIWEPDFDNPFSPINKYKAWVIKESAFGPLRLF